MIVSFDLDDTLFVAEGKFATEKQPRFPYNLIYRERLRLGTVELMRWIRSQNIELWIYTTSFRSQGYIRGLFRCYGIRLDQIVNGERHAKEVQAGRREAMPSKYPGKYKIDLHIDDDVSVAQNGRTLGFRVALVGGPEDGWTERIKEEIEKVRLLKERMEHAHQAR